jgi:light-regulated signal transduction histidine kinase (bacteriophytochrome)
MTLRWRLLASYLVIIVVGVVTLFGAAIWIANAFFRANIQTILAEKGNTPAGIEALNAAFNSGVQNALLDSRIGIAPENLPHVFERFYRVDRSRARHGNTGGNGIGLTIVQCLVEAQGGDIWLESEVGKGTTVHFNLPGV